MDILCHISRPFASLAILPKPCRDEGTVETLQRLAACGNAMFADSGGVDYIGLGWQANSMPS